MTFDNTLYYVLNGINMNFFISSVVIVVNEN